ncbi:MAG: 2-amino-4-hydroxy-6-hydroxymethyldihydropteridine diphosphokinase [Bacteroidia bacterium]|nr:2-amino-4-hydroxy-6-hydroxymethyldihydropteridine diphosphokinase [Bacteroidia bacterium]
MNTYALILGTNSGDRLANLEIARNLLKDRLGVPAAVSPVYETEPWGNNRQPLFYNQAVAGQTQLDARTILEIILDTEKKMGRERAGKWAPRNIDIDLLLLGDLMVEDNDLKVPHPHLHERRFVLVPLQDILPGWVHPKTGLTPARMLENVQDRLEVHLLPLEPLPENSKGSG